VGCAAASAAAHRAQGFVALSVRISAFWHVSVPAVNG
jgi:hypothetical protein